MKTNHTGAFVLFFLLSSTLALSQVDDIKQRSSSHSSGGSRGESGGSSSSSSSSFFVFDFMFNGLAQWQSLKLEKREDVPNMVSLELMLQAAIQPSNYYIVNPRIRANWGLISTDFRFNYLLEEDIDGIKYLRTNDWQILQMNLVTTRNVGFRIGGGVMQEAFSGDKGFGEWTAALTLQDSDLRFGGMVEYRGAEVRKEWNAHFQYRIIEHRHLHGFVTLGVVYQRYYDVINVWGMQSGFVFKLHRP